MADGRRSRDTQIDLRAGDEDRCSHMTDRCDLVDDTRDSKALTSQPYPAFGGISLS